MKKPNIYILFEAKGKKNEAHVYLHGYIGNPDDGADSNTFAKIIAELPDDVDTVILHINSPGGAVYEGLGIVNTILGSELKFIGIIEGLAASMAFVILMACDERKAYKHSRGMHHEASGVSWGNAHEAKKVAEHLKAIDEILYDLIQTATGKTDDEIKAFQNGEDHWYSAVELKEQNYIDEVIDKKAKGLAAQVACYYSQIKNKLIPTTKQEQNNKNEDMNENFVAVATALKLANTASVEEVTTAIAQLQATAARAEQAETELANYKAEANKKAVEAIKDHLIETGKVNTPTAEAMAEKYANDPEGFQAIADVMTPYESVTNRIKNNPQAKRVAELIAKSYDELFQNNELEELKKLDEAAYQAKRQEGLTTN